MQLVHDVAHWRAYCEHERARGARIGLVATMGALHAGHATLFDAAKDHGDVVVATLFVNPRQFNDANDLSRYPTSRVEDRALASAHGVDLLVEPTLEEMWPDYPNATPTTVSVRGIGEHYEGDSRPGHFDGVTSVVAKLFAITGPCRAYFGEKDFQQLTVIRRMVADLCIPVTIIGAATLREPDGLAMSSRNRYLTPEQRGQALVIHRALQVAQRLAASGESSSEKLHAAMRATLAEEPSVRIDYAAVVNPDTLEDLDDVGRGGLLAIAAVVGGTRLIDNTLVAVPPQPGPAS